VPSVSESRIQSVLADHRTREHRLKGCNALMKGRVCFVVQICEDFLISVVFRVLQTARKPMQLVSTEMYLFLCVQCAHFCLFFFTIKQIQIWPVCIVCQSEFGSAFGLLQIFLACFCLRLTDLMQMLSNLSQGVPYCVH
jgi:hypothetical protein